MEHQGFEINLPFTFGLIALFAPYLSKTCGYCPLTNLNTKQPPKFGFYGSFGPLVFF
jgi:hypothetical protein